ncbi:MAG: hypothetical protein Q8L79_09270 [Methylobacter sp.]|uniref:DUF6701 domain-containing protein n=1 Tax=Methylobacter sp. TaxID=2051955 RepID=UPI00272FE748|nr:DUF6701 domain-containing protein [Methylobacter sp.]MDP1665305.1 hypothetical protein [Methylobacter sp.]
MIVGNKYPTNGPATPSGWTLVANGQGSGGLGSAGGDSGQVYSTIFVKEALGTESGNLAVTVTSANTSMARMFRYTKTAGTTWNYAATNGSDNSAGTTWSVTGAANPGITFGDVLIVGTSLNGNRVTNWTESVSATGATFGTTAERNDSNSNTGDDMALIVSEHSVTAGTASAAPVFTMTGSSGSANTNSPTGASVILRVREVPVNCTSQATGNWNASSTWTQCRNGIPLASDTVTIASTHNVTLNVNTPTLTTLTINSGGTLTNTGSNTITLSGAMSNAGTYFGGSGAVTFGSSFTNTGSYSAGSATTTLTGNFSNSGTFTASTGTWVFSGSSAQSLTGATSFNNLTLNNAAGLTLNNGVTVSNTLTLSSGTLAVGANTLTLNGPAIAGTANSLATTTSSNLIFGGSSTGVTVPGSVTTLNNLTINNSNGISLGGSSVTTTLSGILALDTNKLTTGTNTLTLAGNCTASSGSGSLTRTSGYVIGNLKLTFPAGNSTCIYHVGDSIGYSPVTMAIAVTGAGTLSGRVDASDHPDTTAAASGLDATKSANHYWTLTAGTLTHTSYSATFQFCANSGSCTATEVDSGADTSSFIVVLKTSGTWSTKTVGTKDAYSTQATGITGFGEFAVGELSTNNCYSDEFTGADSSSAGTNWSVGYKTGTFGNPVIYGNRLRLTNASSSAATWATLQRLFPASGNKVTVEFNLFSYGGTGGDGIAVVLSDASVAPQAGAFGGSLGYAQKSNPGSDCTTTGGCPGFSGGWLGIAFDEYGNFSTNIEGRFGGYAAAIPQSVAVRGSGSGMSGYRFLQGTGTLSPVLDGNNTANPPHRYRIIVDHTDGVHAWASVERDTSGGGTAYTTLIGCSPGVTSGCTAFDVKDPGYSQNAVPSYWNLSFTGSTGGSTNIHEIDALKVCTVQGLASPVLHHIKIEHGGTACTSNAATVTVKACADADCNALYMSSVTATLSTTGGSWTPASPITFSGGQTTVTLTDNTSRSDTLGATATSPTANDVTECYNGTTQTCILTFAACTFDVIEVGAAVNTPIYTKLANTAFSLDVLSRSGASQTLTAIELVDMSSGTCTSPAGVLSPVTLSPALTGGVPNFSGNQRKTFSFTHNNAAPNVRVRVTTAGPFYSCSSDNFAIRPQTFTVTSNNATQTGSSGDPVFRAGADPFTLSATALYSSIITTNYTGTPKLNLDSGMVTTTLAHVGSLGSTTFSSATSGVATASGLTYSEVGNFSLAQYAVYDDTFAQVDSVKGECTSAFSNTLSNSRYSCQFGSSAAGAFGRFVPDHFTVSATVANVCTAGTFTYMGQTFSLSTANVVEAENAANGVTQNYAGAYAHGTISFGAENDDNGTDLSSRLTFSNNGSWASGIYTLTSAIGTFARPTAATADATWGSYESLDIGLTVNDSDVTTSPKVKDANMTPGTVGGSSFTYKKLSASALHMRFGRIGLQNAYGSELVDLAMPLTAEYWNGDSWVKNTDDQCTTGITLLLLPDPIAADGLVPAELCVWDTGSAGSSGLGCAVAGTIANRFTQPPLAGDFNLNFRAPGIGNTGALDITATVPVWMRFNWDGVDQGSDGNLFDDNPTARVTFGIYKGNSRFIYIRELY